MKHCLVKDHYYHEARVAIDALFAQLRSRASCVDDAWRGLAALRSSQQILAALGIIGFNILLGDIDGFVPRQADSVDRVAAILKVETLDNMKQWLGGRMKRWEDGEAQARLR